MKRVLIILLLCFAFAFSAFSGSSGVRAESQTVTDYGAYLKSIGIVQGFPDGSLRENKYITQAEYIALLANMLKKEKVVRRANLVKPLNFFDKLVNKAYHAYLILKDKLLDFYYAKVIYYIPYYRQKYGADKNKWFFPYAMYLKRNGFNIPEEFRPNGVLNTENAVKWLLDALSLDAKNELVVSGKDITQANLVHVLSYEHGIPVGVPDLPKPIKRGEAFKLVYSVIAK